MTILSSALQDFVFRIDEARQEGWEFDANSPPTVYGFTYEAAMWRDATEEQLENDAIEAAKPSRGEILAKARAAKAEKAKASQEA